MSRTWHGTIQLFLVLSLLSGKAFGEGRKIQAGQETIVSKIGVARIGGGKNRKANALNLVEIQTAIVKVLTERSYVEAIALDTAATPDDETPKIVGLARDKNVDGILTGEALGDSLKMALRSGHTGRTLARWTFPMPEQKDKARQNEILGDMVNSIVKDFPYRGYIMFVKGDNVQLNLGGRHAIRPGVRLSVFEFQGSRPTFSSPKTQLGEIVVTKISANLAIGKVKSAAAPIKKFAKVDMYVAQVANIQEHEIRYSRKFWAGAGINFQFMDSTTPDNSNMLKRRYKLTLSPFIRVSAGKGRFAASLDYGSASNPSNDVTFLMGQASAEIYQADLGEETSLITSFGGTYSSYKANPKEGQPAQLTSATNYSGLLEQAIHYRVTASTRAYGFGQLLYPYFSKDEVNGDSKAFTSFGFGFGGGLRIYLFPNFALESLVASRVTTWAMINGNVQEIQYGLTLQGLYFW